MAEVAVDIAALTKATIECLRVADSTLFAHLRLWCKHGISPPQEEILNRLSDANLIDSDDELLEVTKLVVNKHY